MGHKYTKDQIDFISKNVIGRSNAELTKMFNRKFNLDLQISQIRAFKANRKLSSGLDGRFKNGHKPWNTGVKGVVTGGVETQFKKGQKPWNYKPIGTERVNGDGYVDIKIADPNKWKLKHRIIWEKHNGPIPKGYNVIFGDGDNRNFGINNLILVSKKQMAIMNKNKLIQNNADLTRSAIIIADLIAKISERKKAAINKK